MWEIGPEKRKTYLCKKTIGLTPPKLLGELPHGGGREEYVDKKKESKEMSSRRLYSERGSWYENVRGKRRRIATYKTKADRERDPGMHRI